MSKRRDGEMLHDTVRRQAAQRATMTGPRGTERLLIESEIVIVDDGTEEPFDPSSWFK